MKSNVVLKPVNALLWSTTVMLAGSAMAFDIPHGLYVDDDTLYWQPTSPSTNIYENGNYVATVHGLSSYEPVRDGAVYQLVAHDYGVDFSALSEPFLVPDDDTDGDDDENDGEPFDEARVYFELNDTDGDLGLHALMDGDSWQMLTIEDPNDYEILSLTVDQSLLAQGMTELFFESSEPTFDELNPAEFFARFPAGEYDINGITLAGEELESEAILSHVIPAAPANIVVSGALLPASCEDTEGPVVAAPYVVSWDPVQSSHATLGIIGEVIVDRYQFVIEREHPSPLLLSFDINPDTTQVSIPQGLIGSGEEIKVEILTIADTGNQSASESCFVSAD